jgi:alkylation response protein AidB-like acyl-CoA dehydrogenase
MSEHDAGSNLAGIRTSARRDGSRFVINGRKIWTSFGDRAEWRYAICRTSSGGAAHEGISEVVVPMDSKGVEARTIRDASGNRHFCEVTFDDVTVPVDNLIGVEGLAFKQTMRQLEYERGGADRLFSNHALFRRSRDRADHTDPLIRQDIARLESAYHVGRLLVIREALRAAPAGFSAATKCFCTEHEQHVARFASHVFGPAATLWNAEAQAICYAPAYTIMGGTSNIMRNILAERVLGLPR